MSRSAERREIHFRKSLFFCGGSFEADHTPGTGQSDGEILFWSVPGLICHAYLTELRMDRKRM